MDLKSLFPVSYKQSMLVALITYICIAVVAGVMIWFAGMLGGWIPVVGPILNWVLKIVSAIVEVYVVIGIVLKILVAINVIK